MEENDALAEMLQAFLMNVSVISGFCYHFGLFAGLSFFLAHRMIIEKIEKP